MGSAQARGKQKKLPLSSILLSSTGIVLTNDGNAILREIDVSHPAAKV
jgi:chaperonin GroEL (HSP60 family)